MHNTTPPRIDACADFVAWHGRPLSPTNRNSLERVDEMSAYYEGIEFKTRLLAQWAAFFDLAKWKWQCNPAAVAGWVPDFRVSFPCGHSECGEKHTLLVSVLDVDQLSTVSGHPALQYAYVVPAAGGVGADAGALFGRSPLVSQWEMAHGAGGGAESVANWVSEDVTSLWKQAGALVAAADQG